MFDKWIDFVFNHPISDSSWYMKMGFDELEDLEEKFSNQVTLQFFTKLMSDPIQVLDRFPNEQVNQGLMYLFYTLEDRFMIESVLSNIPAPWGEFFECVEMMFNFFNIFFVERCSEKLATFDEGIDNRLNESCFMWWDRIYNLKPQRADGKFGEVCIDVMRRILMIKHVACQESAIHGLGHFMESYPDKAKLILDEYLSRSIMRDDLRVYAEAALKSRAGWL